MSVFDEIAALGFKFDICYDDDDEPVTGDTEEAQLMRVAVNDISPPLPGLDVEEWLQRD
tara:strand:+ start:8332 stop:8508 length:177 start_codon:yes stop_codon:yes gene_type:complete